MRGPTAGAGLVASGRLAWLDIARGIALLAMAIYHFTWDLSVFGVIDPWVPFETPFREFARSIAATFLFLVGIGLVIGHGEGIRWRSFWRRFAMIAGAAGLITAGTLVATPQGFIFHGILHMIAIGSLAGLALVRAPWPLAVATGLLVAWVGLTYESTFFDARWLWWTGLATERPVSNDFVPFFPAFAAIAFGIAAAKLLRIGRESTGDRAVGRAAPSALWRPFAWAGRHSLLVYLIHQPILIGVLWVALQVLG